MKFEWDKKLIRNNLENLKKKKYKTENDKIIMYYYETYLYPLPEVLLESTNKISFNTQEMLKLVKDTYEELKNYINMLPKKIRIVFYSVIYGLGGMYTSIPNDYFKITDDDKNIDFLKHKSYEVYSSIDKKFIPLLDQIYDKNLVTITNKKLKYIFDNSDSLCFFDEYNKSSFIILDDKDKLSTTSSTLNHEIAHCLDFLAGSKEFYFGKLGPIAEMHSIYMGLYSDDKSYKDTNNIDYLKSNYNYLNYLQENISKTYLLLRLGKLDDMRLEKVKDYLENLIVGEIEDIDAILNYILSVNVRDVIYILSAIFAVHMLENEDGKELFTKSLFNAESTVYKVLKSINFNFSDIYYPCEIFNEYNARISSTIRKRS